MSVETLKRPQSISLRSAREVQSIRETQSSSFKPNWGPEDMHAIKAIAYIMNGIFGVALVMYGTITLLAWLGVSF